MAFYGSGVKYGETKYGANYIIDIPLEMDYYDVYGNSVQAAVVDETVTILSGGILQLQKSATAPIQINDTITIQASGRLDLEVEKWADVVVTAPIVILPGGKIEMLNRYIIVAENTKLVIKPEAPSNAGKLPSP